jgi:hypothetical protein
MEATMTVVEFIRRSISDINNTIIDDVKALTPQQLAWKPAPKANPIGFIFWHFIRHEDETISSLQKKPSVWESEKWYQKLGMDPKAQGTGFKEPEVDKVATLPLADLLKYTEHVAQNAQDYLITLKDTELDNIPDPNSPRRTLVVILRSFIIAHGWWHIGEIKYIKGMLGMPFAY